MLKIQICSAPGKFKMQVLNRLVYSLDQFIVSIVFSIHSA